MSLLSPEGVSHLASQGPEAINARLESFSCSSSSPEPMDLSYAEDEEAELLAAEQRTSIRRCFTYGSTRQLRASCPVRNQRKAPPS
ncbi:hypothetical protein GQ600_17793 [Phytophthora cactorum]|nr:hypothetical protein GQ600_17793 [Phytophthora cactorum]